MLGGGRGGGGGGPGVAVSAGRPGLRPGRGAWESPPSLGRRLQPSAGAGRGRRRLCVDLAARGHAAGAPPPRQPLVFGAMVHRDEAFETIFSQYMKITAAAASGSDS